MRLPNISNQNELLFQLLKYLFESTNSIFSRSIMKTFSINLFKIQEQCYYTYLPTILSTQILQNTFIVLKARRTLNSTNISHGNNETNIYSSNNIINMAKSFSEIPLKWQAAA